MNIPSPFGYPVYIMAKPAGALCNLHCRYCYYLEKSQLYKESKKQIMTDELLDKFIREYIESQTTPNVLFTWHGGEPLLRSLFFYEKIIKLQKKYGKGRNIDNCIQTNGTLLTKDWCKFFHEHKWLVGVSIDGPEEFHDTYRKDKSQEGTFKQVMQGIELLNKYHVEWNAMAAINNINVKDPLRFYRFFKEIGCRYIQFTPVVERLNRHEDGRYLAAPDETETVDVTDFSVSPDEWGKFLCTIFDEWVRNDVGHYFVQLFDSTLANWVGETPGLCSMGKTCGHSGVMEFNGDVYACDHFVFPQYKLGNIYKDTLVEMMYSPRQLQFGQDKSDKLPRQCKECEYLFACNGECPKNRFTHTPSGDPGLNYLCKGYFRFFKHVAPYMDYMKKELLAQRAPANIMEAISKNYLT